MLLVKNGIILTMAGKEFKNGYVLAEGEKISKVGENPDEVTAIMEGNKDITVIDAKGGYVLPGFIDAHCHVGMWEDSLGFEGADGNEKTDPVTPQLRAIDGVNHLDRAFEEAREGGVTTVVTGPGSANVIGGQFAALKTYGRCVDEMIVREPVALKVAFGENVKKTYNERKQTPTTRMATAALLRQYFYKALDYKGKLDDYGRDSEKYNKPEFDMAMEAILMVLRGEIPLKAHAHRADDIMTAIRIAREFNVDFTIEHCTEGALIKDILKEQNISVVVGPLLTDRSKPELKNLSLKTPGILANAGIKLAIMTDHPVVPIQYLRLCASMAVSEGMDPGEALKAITINAAEICRISDRVGSLEEGKDADIVVFDRHPFEIEAKVVTTIINGKVVYTR